MATARTPRRKRPMADWIMKILFTLMAAGLGSTLLVVGIRESILQRRTLAGARPFDATIVASTVRVSKSNDLGREPPRDRSTTSYSPDVRFRYDVDGRTHESDQLAPTVIGHGYASEADAQEVIRPYPVGARVTAYVDPDHPDRGFLQPVHSHAPLVFILVGAALLPIAAALFRWL